MNYKIKIKSICNNTQKDLFTALFLYITIINNPPNYKNTGILDIKFNYTTTETSNTENLINEIIENLSNGDFSNNKIGDFFYVNNISIFEDWFNQFQFQYYINNKILYPVQEIPKMKLKKIINNDELEKFWEYEIKRYIQDKNMSKNIYDRLFYFTKDILKIDLNTIPFDLNTVYEISLSRNCIVHNNGKIDFKYTALPKIYQKHSKNIIINKDIISEQVDVFLKLISIYRDIL